MNKKKRHTPEQIAAVLKRQEGDMKVAEICRQEGISEQTFYRWKSLYGGMARRLQSRAAASVAGTAHPRRGAPTA